jgi:hypothetical protein
LLSIAAFAVARVVQCAQLVQLQELSDEGGPRRHGLDRRRGRSARLQRQRRGRTGSLEAEEDSEDGLGEEGVVPPPPLASARATSPRQDSDYAWLQACEPSSAFFVPQV